jgi:predicted PurR-regulated permease PerM
MNKDFANRFSVILLALSISILFLSMISGFLMAIVMAAIFSGLLYPLYLKILNRFKGKTILSGMLTLLIFFFIVLIPIAGLTAVLVEQALSASETLGPLIRKELSHPNQLLNDVQSLPVVNKVFPDPQALADALEKLIQGAGGFIVNNLSNVTTGTVNFLFQFFIMLFTMYYFLVYGRDYLGKLLFSLPLNSNDEKRLLEKFTSVTRATLKGTFIIGAIQGAMGGVAMWIAGIPNTLFWGVIMAVFAIIPAIGPAIIWFPASIFLFVQGETTAAVGLFLFGAIAISNIDNLLRPRLVGREAQLPDLMILFGTLGGLALFGAVGLIIGPIIAALFVTIWDIYGEVFHNLLERSHLQENVKELTDDMLGDVPDDVEAPSAERNSGDD